MEIEYLNQYGKLIVLLKKIIKRELNRKNYKDVLKLISICARLHYSLNQQYCDNDLEAYIECVASEMLNRTNLAFQPNENTILFYDGFGFNGRGLIFNYLKALCKVGKVIYVVDSQKKGMLPDVMKILDENNGIVSWLSGTSEVARVYELSEIFQQFHPHSAFMYMMPDDVVAPVVFSAYKDIVVRFEINLTDHAFWLGKKALDKCIEFRDYGACISNKYRDIHIDKIVKLPFYPEINQDQNFLGYPFPFDEEKDKLIFTGGALYKTFGGGNLYYDILEYILINYPECIIWYAGSGDASKINKLKLRYPERIYLTAERPDFFCIMQKCYLYLSTYPVCGGLMFQFAALAGKVPITLKYDNISDGFLLNQSELGIEFEQLEALKKELDRLLSDEEYCRNKGNSLQSSILNSTIFERQINKIICEGKSDYPICTYEFDTTRFRKEYLNNLSQMKIYERLTKKNNLTCLKYIPLRTSLGILYKFWEKHKGCALKKRSKI